MTGESSSSRPPPPQAPSNLLAPGFRFYPNEEELLCYYLKRKVSGLPILVDAIAEVDLYKAEPWDLPGKSHFRSGDMEWYFFTPLHHKRSTGSRINRTTSKGYWKTTGKDRRVRHGSRVVGMKKTLVFHLGRAPGGERTDWVMHEYRLEDEELVRSGILQETFVVCRIFHKSGTGLHNGPRSSASYLQKEWDGDDEQSLNMVQVNESGNGDDALMYVSADDYLELGELLEILSPAINLKILFLLKLVHISRLMVATQKIHPLHLCVKHRWRKVFWMVCFWRISLVIGPFVLMVLLSYKIKLSVYSS